MTFWGPIFLNAYPANEVTHPYGTITDIIFKIYLEYVFEYFTKQKYSNTNTDT